MSTATPTRRNPRPTPRGGAARAEPRARVVEPREREPRERRPRRKLSRNVVLVIAAFAIVVVVFGGYAITRSPLMDLDRVEVSGGARTTDQALLEAAALVPGTAMTDLDLGAARDRIELLPWVDHATVKRHWPNSVRISVDEREPFAVLQAVDGPVVIDRAARVLERGTGPGSLVVIAVAAGAVEVGQNQPDTGPLIQVVQAIRPELKSWVLEVRPDHRGRPELRLKDNIQVVLSDTTALGDKMLDLATVLTRVELRDICRIDLTAVRSPAVVRRPNCA